MVHVRRLVLMARLDERGKQRMRARGLRLEFGVELDGQVPGMARELRDLDAITIMEAATETAPANPGAQAVALQQLGLAAE